MMRLRIQKHVYLQKILLILVLLVAYSLVVGITTDWFFISQTIPTSGNIRAIGVEVFWDKEGNDKVDSIDWGTIHSGSSYNVTIQIRNISNFNTTLYLETANWNPVNLSDYANLTWDYKNQTVQPGAMVEVTLTLSVSSSSSFFYYLLALPSDEFSFDVIIGARD